MGLWSTVKGWFSSGVKVELVRVEDPFSRTDSMMSGKVRITAKQDKTVLSVDARFYMESTYYEDGEEKTETKDIARFSSKDVLVQDEYPFEVAAGETKELDFYIMNIDMREFADQLADKGGLLGAAGKAAKMFGGSDKKTADAYFVEVTVDIKGTVLDPSDKRQITVIGG